MTVREIELFGLIDIAIEAWGDCHNPSQRSWDAIDALLAGFASGDIPGTLRDAHEAVRALAEHVRDLDDGRLAYSATRLGSLFDRLRKARNADETFLVGGDSTDRNEARFELEPEDKPCSETWAELFALSPPISFEQLKRMKCCSLSEIYARARIHNAIPHLPPEEQAAAMERERQKQAQELLAKELAADIAD